MKRVVLIRVLAILFSLLLAACSSTTVESDTDLSGPVSLEPDQQGSGLVTEVLEAGKYSFVCLNSGGEAFWLATTLSEVKVGDELSYEGVLVMRDFHSDTLSRTFPVVLFVSRAQVSKKVPVEIMRKVGIPSGHPLIPENARRKNHVSIPDNGSIPQIPGARQLSDIVQKSDQLKGQTVSFVGKVIKVNKNIMGRNWIHVSDGTEAEGIRELTVTSQEAPEIGATLLFRGNLEIDRTLARGYFFPLLLEDAEIENPTG